MYRPQLTALLLAATIPAAAQHTLRGRVLEGESPVGYATTVLLRDGRQAAGTTTDDAGGFVLTFALHDLGDLPPQQHRGDKSRHQNNGHDNGHNLHDFFHFLSVLKTKTVVPASSNPILR